MEGIDACRFPRGRSRIRKNGGAETFFLLITTHFLFTIPWLEAALALNAALVGLSNDPEQDLGHLSGHCKGMNGLLCMKNFDFPSLCPFSTNFDAVGRIKLGELMKQDLLYKLAGLEPGP